LAEWWRSELKFLSGDRDFKVKPKERNTLILFLYRPTWLINYYVTERVQR
jgi:hypothetical protein